MREKDFTGNSNVNDVSPFLTRFTRVRLPRVRITWSIFDQADHRRSLNPSLRHGLLFVQGFPFFRLFFMVQFRWFFSLFFRETVVSSAIVLDTVFERIECFGCIMIIKFNWSTLVLSQSFDSRRSINVRTIKEIRIEMFWTHNDEILKIP